MSIAKSLKNSFAIFEAFCVLSQCPGEAVWETAARLCLVFLEFMNRNTDKVY